MISLRRTAATTFAACAAALLPLTPPAAVASSPTVSGVPSQAAAGAPQARASVDQRVDAVLDRVRDHPNQLRQFLHDMPKGGDLHNHLSGAASTELLIRLAAEDGLCIDGTLTAKAPPCGPGTRPATDTRTDTAFRDQVIRAWSMQDFQPGAESGHDHFFATFGKFGEATWRHPGRLLADVTDTAARQNQTYLETMLSPASTQAAALAAQVGWHADFATMRAKLLADGRMAKVVAQARADADAGMKEFRATSHCDSARPAPGCAVTVRFESQASRGSAPERVFTQLMLGMELASQDQRFVAVNLVQPEDSPVSLRDYDLQMRMLQYLHGQYPKAHITLHAGELVPGLVKPADLAFHIREAVLTAHAERIGHGVDLVHEDDYRALLRVMAQRHVAVEVPLTSNEQILGVSGKDHPFPVYQAAGVPVALSTDDPGVERTDITEEYVKATTRYGLSYPQLKELVRNTLEYAFLPGRSLWQEPGRYQVVRECAADRPGSQHPGRACQALLDSSAKARVQWREEAAFTAFENAVLRPRA